MKWSTSIQRSWFPPQDSLCQSWLSLFGPIELFLATNKYLSLSRLVESEVRKFEAELKGLDKQPIARCLGWFIFLAEPFLFPSIEVFWWKINFYFGDKPDEKQGINFSRVTFTRGGGDNWISSQWGRRRMRISKESESYNGGQLDIWLIVRKRNCAVNLSKTF